MVKEDGSQAQVDEKLQFKVIEFNKDAKRIILSHSRIHEEVKRAERAAEGGDEKKVTKRVKKEEVPATPTIEKTTLGDIQELADLKDQMVSEAAEKLVANEAKKAKTEKAEKPKAEKPKSEKKEAVKEEPAKEEVAKPATGDRATVNFSEDDELNYKLKKFNLSQSKDNRELLTKLGSVEKEALGKRVLSHEDVDAMIEKNIEKFAEKKSADDAAAK